MAKIPLRAYLKEIENLIERGEIEQAVSHSKNILQFYPKHIETYRLLGKAFLESQRYSEAADILQRVLSVIPDDFISQIGMSIIREDEGNMDAAIWHMERAYEVQPFNPAVQDELRRLYGRRDGVEPPKIRLTRGALVRMYSRGELYPQAIAETRAALAEDPQRLDLLVLLARLYYLNGQKNDAAEACSELIKKLPFCLEANRLLAEILPTTSRADETPKFQQRIYAMDPYEAFVSPSAPTSQQVPDQAVMVEQFIWEPGAESAQAPDWTRTVGVEWEETEEEVLPEWLSSLQPEAAAPTSTPEDQAIVDQASESVQEVFTTEEKEEETGQEDLIPDWMKEAGWETSNRSADEIMAEQEEQEEPAEEISPAEIPAWLQSIAPSEAVEGQEEEEDRTSWLEDILTPPGETNGKSKVESAPSVEEQETGDDISFPEWLAGMKAGKVAGGETEEALPDWFSEEDAVEVSPTAESPESEEEEAGQEEPAGAVEETPKWLQDLSSQSPEVSVSAEETTDWLESAADEKFESQAEAAEEIPDWLQALGSEPLQKVEETQEEGFEWAQAPEDESATTEAESTLEAEELPAWLQDETEQPVEVAEQPAAELPEEENLEGTAELLPSVEGEELPGAVQEAAKVETGMPDLDDIDATMAWLEALAAKQGADEETLVTPKEERTEMPPDWLKEKMESHLVAETETTEGQPPTELAPSEAELEVVDLSKFVDAQQDTVVEEDLQQDETEETVPPAEIVELEEAFPTEVEEQHAAAFIETILEEPVEETTEQAEALPEMPDMTDEVATMAWLEALAARQGADEATLVTPAEERSETPPDWLRKELEQQEQAMDIEPVAAAAEGTSEVAETIEAQPSQAEQAVERETTEELPSEATTPDFSDIDAAMAWLESLAARQGAEEATLITAPGQRTDVPPDWVQKEVEQAEGSEEAAPVETEEKLPEVVGELSEVQATQADEETLPKTEELSEVEGKPQEESLPEWRKAESQVEAFGEILTFDEEVSSETETPAVELTEKDVFAPQDRDVVESDKTAWIETGEVERTGVLPAEEQTEQHPDWLQGVEEEEAETGSEEVQWPVEVPKTEEELPDWLIAKGNEQPTEQVEFKAGEVPAWLADLSEETEQEPSPTDDHFPPISEDYQAAWAPELAPGVEPEATFMEPEKPGEYTVETSTGLADLQTAMNRGNLEEALVGYNQLIQQDQHLEQIIHDLRDALYRYPVDIAIWQTLGDAYARNNQLQEALDAYTKAEELLR